MLALFRRTVRHGSTTHRTLMSGTALIVVLALAGCSSASSGGATSPTDQPAESSASPHTSPPTESPAAVSVADANAELTALEAEYDARLGVFALDTGTNTAVSWRADERFAYASTHKALTSAALLAEFGMAGLTEAVPITAADIASYSPVTEQRIGTTMTLAELAQASVQMSDSTAANIVMERLGGPAGFGVILADLGDDVTEVSRIEPALNEATPGDTRDTTSPRAFATDLQAYLLGDELDDESRTALTIWMTEATTGNALIRAGAPAGWTVADKSGAAGYGTRNNIAVLWPTDGDPIVMAVLSSRDASDADYDDQLVADAAAAAIAALTATD